MQSISTYCINQFHFSIFFLQHCVVDMFPLCHFLPRRLEVLLQEGLLPQCAFISPMSRPRTSSAASGPYMSLCGECHGHLNPSETYFPFTKNHGRPYVATTLDVDMPQENGRADPLNDQRLRYVATRAGLLAVYSLTTAPGSGMSVPEPSLGANDCSLVGV